MAVRTTTLSQLDFYHYFCRAIPYSQGAQRAVDILRDQGAVFLQGREPITKVKKISRPDDFVGEGPDPSLVLEPGAVLSEDGSILGLLNLQHRLLTPDVSTLCTIQSGGLAADAPAFGSFGFFAKTCGISVGQNAEITNKAGVEADAVATGLLALALHFYPCLRPMYGWVDESGWNLPQGKALAAPRPRYLFWANFFGPEYVLALGRDFLKGAPGWASVDLPDGGILHVCTESYKDWWENDQPELLPYFRRKFPKVQIYRAQPIPY
jgi:hypothetical protein